MFNKFFILFIFCFILGSISAEIKEYNYYERDYFGSFKIEKLDIDNIEGFPLPKYEVVTDIGNNIEEIRGYYAAGELKFIDLVGNGRIKQTKYFKINGREILVKKFKWDGKNLIMDLWHQMDSSSKTSEFFVFKKDHYDYKKVVIRENQTYANKIEEAVGEFNLNLKPLYIEEKIYPKSSPDNPSTIDIRKYEYNEKDQKIKLTRLINSKKFEVQRFYYDKNSKLVRKQFHDFLHDNEYEERWEDKQWVYYKKRNNQFIRVKPHFDDFKMIKNIEVFYYFNEKNKLTQQFEDRIRINFNDEQLIAKKVGEKLIYLSRSIHLFPYLIKDSIVGKRLGFSNRYFFKGYN